MRKHVFLWKCKFFEKRLRQCIQTMLKQLRETFFNFGEQKLNMSRLDFVSCWMFEDFSVVVTESAQCEPRPFIEMALECNCI